jgi:hypothetical protein
LGCDADAVWKVVSDFVGFSEVLLESTEAHVEGRGEGIGMLRAVTMGDNVVVERLEEVDEANRRTSYSMPVSGPFPVRDDYATIHHTEGHAAMCASLDRYLHTGRSG